LEEALADFTQAIELQPTHTKYYLHRRLVLDALGRTEEARADAERAAWLERLVMVNRLVQAQPDEARSWRERAEHLYQGKRHEPALADAERAIQLAAPGSAEQTAALLVAARIRLALGQYEQAVEIATRVLKQSPSDEAHSLRGEAHYALGNFAAAVEDFRAARRLDPLVQQACLKYAEQLESRGEVQQAGYFREQAEALAPERLIRPATQETAEPLPFPTEAVPAAQAEQTAATP
jgi:tetratricopeptide (TPR) repeat protein